MRSRVFNPVKALICTLIGAALITSPVMADDGRASKNPADTVPMIMIVNSYHPWHVWTEDEIDGELEALKKAYPNIFPHIEFMDVKRDPTEANFNCLKEHFGRKYGDIKLDMIIANDNAALDFAVRNRHAYFSNAPIVFAGINGYGALRGTLPPDVTGVVETIDPAGTFDIVFRLQPHVRNVYVITDRTASGIGTRSEIEPVLAAYRERANVRFLDDLDMEPLLEFLANVEPTDAVYMTYYNRDGTGRYFGHEESVKMVTAASAAPVYHAYSFSLGLGVVGGRLLDGKTHGRTAARMALAILDGGTADEVPILEKSPCPAMFDFAVMQKFNLPVALLPPDAVLVNRPPGLFGETMRLVLVAAVVILTLSGWVILLLKNIRARKAVEALLIGHRDELEARVNERTAELRASEEKYRELVQNAASIILRWKRDGSITFLNEFGQEFFGFSEAEIVGRSVVGTIVPETESTGRNLNALIMEISVNPEKYYTNINENVTKSGQRVWIQWTNRVVESPDGEKEVFSVGTDITAKKKLEDRLRQAEKMEAVGQLAGGIAHDFNNHLVSIMGFSEILEEECTDPELRALAARISRSSRSAADLTSKLLAFGLRGACVLTALDVHRILRDVIELLSRSIGKNIVIRENLAAREHVICGDPSQLQNVFFNLAINARDAMPSGGELVFSTAVVELTSDHCGAQSWDVAPGKYIEIDVSDSGTGIKPELREKIFEPFFTTKPPGRGTGMGLASVYGSVRNHSGLIQLESAENAGTTFKIFLPLPKEPLTVPPIPEKRKTRPTFSIHAMIVDDEKDVCDYAEMLLKRMGVSVVAFTDPREALEHYRSNCKKIDIVLIDMMMPDMDGRQTFLELKAINPKIKAMLISGYSIGTQAQSVLDAGVKGFLRKPFATSELAEKLKEVLRPPLR